MSERTKHSKTGEKFRDMSTETLRLVHRRKYKIAADTTSDQLGAQKELRRRRITKANQEE